MTPEEIYYADIRDLSNLPPGMLTADHIRVLQAHAKRTCDPKGVLQYAKSRYNRAIDDRATDRQLYWQGVMDMAAGIIVPGEF
jgi:hypothetical protein